MQRLLLKTGMIEYIQFFIMEYQKQRDNAGRYLQIEQRSMGRK